MSKAKTKFKTVYLIECVQKTAGKYYPRIFCYMTKGERTKMLRSLMEDEVFSCFKSRGAIKMEFPVPVRSRRRATLPVRPPIAQHWRSPMLERERPLRRAHWSF